MVFKYRAFHHNGQRINGYLWAKTKQAVIERLHSVDIETVQVKKVIHTKRTVKVSKTIDFIWYLCWMLRAGIPLREALNVLAQALKGGKQNQLALQLMGYMDHGLLFSEAMAFFPSVFSPLMMYYVIVGEKTGSLAQQLSTLIALLQWQIKWREKMFRALSYPLLTLTMAIGALCYLVVEIVPSLIELLPPEFDASQLTHLLLVSRGLQKNGGYLLGAFGLLGGVFIIACQTLPSWKVRKDLWILKLPILGRILHDLYLAYMVEVIAHLHTAGFSLLECLRIVSELVSNKGLQQQLTYAAQMLEEGNTLTESFSHHHIFPPVLLHALYLAEKSGHVTEAFQHTVQFFRDRVLRSMRLLETLTGPCCLLLVAGVLLGILLGVFGPLFEVIGQSY